MVTWIDVLAGNIAGALWIAMVLYSRRLWLERQSFMTAALLVFWLGAGLAVLIWRMAYWAGELSSARALARALQ